MAKQQAETQVAAESARETQRVEKEAEAARRTERFNSPELLAEDLRTTRAMLLDALPALQDRAAAEAVTVNVFSRGLVRPVYWGRGLQFKIRRQPGKLLRSVGGWKIGSQYQEGSGYTMEGGGHFAVVLDSEGYVHPYMESADGVYSALARRSRFNIRSAEEPTVTMVLAVLSNVRAVQQRLDELLGTE